MGPLQAQQFLTIAKYMNLTKAANELYISPSALSQSLARMEHELGVRLFYRDGSRLILSYEGEHLRPYFQEYVAAHHTLLEQAHELTRKPMNILRIGYSGSALRFAAFYMTDYFGNRGGNETVLTYATRPVLEDMLLNEQLDLAITYPPLTNHQLSSIPLCCEKNVLVVPDKHPLAGRASVSLKDLTDVAFIGNASDNHFRILCDELCGDCGFTPNYVKELDYQSMYQLIAQCAGGDQYAFFSPEDCFEETFGEGYQKITLAEKHMATITSVSWLTSRKIQFQYKDLIDYITATYAKQADYHAKYTGFMAKSFRSDTPFS